LGGFSCWVAKAKWNLLPSEQRVGVAVVALAKSVGSAAAAAAVVWLAPSFQINPEIHLRENERHSLITSTQCFAWRGQAQYTSAFGGRTV
jgi:hypothetical protein